MTVNSWLLRGRLENWTYRHVFRMQSRSSGAGSDSGSGLGSDLGFGGLTFPEGNRDGYYRGAFDGSGGGREGDGWIE